MPDIWQQFHQLPRPIRDAVATPSALATIDRLEQAHPNLDAASLVMRTMIKEIPIERLVDTISIEGKIDGVAAEQVVADLTQGVFAGVADYLGLKPTPPVAPPTPPIPDNLPLASQSESRPIRPVTQAPTSVTSLSKPNPDSIPARPPVPVTTVPGVITSPGGFSPLVSTGPIAPTQAYSDDAAKEIAEQSQRLQRLTNPDPAQDLDDIARQTLDQHQLTFSDELLTKRAVAVLKARLKDIRQPEETLAMLTRDPKVGGLGLDPDLAANLVASLETRAKELKSRGMVSPRSIPVPPVPPPVPVVPQMHPEPKPPFRKLEVADSLSVGAPPPSMTEPARPSAPIKRPLDIPAPTPMIATPAPVIRSPSPTFQRGRVLERPKVADVTQPHRTYGPAEEMRSLTLAEFRRLGQGAGESTRKLLDKFLHLQQESFKLWADAISGWRQSEIYRLYLEMGGQSLEENIAISEIVQRRARNNQAYLSEHEFTAVADMNRQLQH